MTRAGAPLISRWEGTAGPQKCHSPELSLPIHKVLLRQCYTWAGVDDKGLAVLEVGCFEPPLGQLGKDQSL